MNDRERIAQLETMLIEEREKAFRFIFLLENYARGLDMMARAAYLETPSGTTSEKNAMAVKQQSSDMLGWIDTKAGELRGLMGREISTDEETPDPMVDVAEVEPNAVIH